MTFSTQGIKILQQSKESIEYQSHILIKFGLVIGKLVIRNTGKRIHVWFFDLLNSSNNWYDSHQFCTNSIFGNKKMFNITIPENECDKWELHLRAINVTTHNALF